MNKGLLSFLAVFLLLQLSAQDPALYRTFDGTQNNVANPDWGAANTALLQLAGVGYSDGYSAIGGVDRPNPRFLSNIIFDQPELLPDPMALSDFTWVFGQFIDHDLGLTENNSEPINIPIPQGDPEFDPLGFGNVQIALNRNVFIEGTGTGLDNPRRHPNEITAFLDASAVYGHNQEHADWLRSFVDGKMKVSTGNLLPYNTIDGELNSPVDFTAPHMADDVGISPRLFVAGDLRVNENPLLLSFHTLFVREHNRRAEIIKADNPDWTDDQIFFLSRKYVSGHMQAIVYNEWLPAMGVVLDEYTGYDETEHPQLSNTFTAAAFRVGHTLLNSIVQRVGPDGNELPQGHLTLRASFFNPAAIPEVGGLDPYLAGMAQQVQQTMDNRIVDDVRNFLFGPPGAGGTDLASINIQRGRERGLPSFNAIRQAYGLTPYVFLEQINADLNVYGQLFQAYFGDISKVDPWVGMLAESPMDNALFGETILAIMSTQFTSLRDGDRFFYLNDPVLTDEQKMDIHTTTFRDVIMHNTNITLMQDNVFLAMPYADICGSSTSSVEGTVSVHTTGATMGDVQVNYLVNGETETNLITGINGTYDFSGIPACEAGTLSASYSDSWLNGVTVQDIVLISRHILSLEEIVSGYQLLAADANVDANVNILDIIAIRRLILDLSVDLPTDAPMWTFIPADYTFTDELNPWDDDYPTSLTLPSPAMMLENQSFIAFKRGDVNATAILATESFQQDEVIAGRSGAANIITEDLILRANVPTEITINLAFADYEGDEADYQFSLGGEALTISDVKMADQYAGFAHLTDRGNLRFCGEWFSDQPQQYTFTVTSERNGRLSNFLELDRNDLMAFVVYDKDQTQTSVLDLGYQSSNAFVGDLPAETSFQAYPNPFVEQLSFKLPAVRNGGLATLELFDIQGRLVLREQRDLAADSPTTWTINAAQLAGGNYTYRLLTSDQEYSGQVVSISK